MQPSPTRRAWLSLSSADWLLLLLVGLLQIALCVFRSSHRLFWSDELLGAKVLGDPSFRHMFTGWREGADGGGFMYYILARLWIDLFTLSELTLRLFSTVGVFTSVVCIWIAGRKYYDTLPLAFAVALVFFTAPTLLWQLVNGRFYGTLMAAAGLATLAYFKASRSHSYNWPDLLLFALAHAFLCSSHILGMVYSAALLLALIALDRMRSRWRPVLYLAGLAGWLVLPFSYRAIVASTSVASTAFWTRKPSIVDLLFGSVGFSRIVLAAALLLLICIATRKFFSRSTIPQPFGTPTPDRLPVYIFAACLLLVELVLFAKSRLPGISIFSERYLAPLSLGLVLIIADLFTRAFPGASLHRAKPFPRLTLAISIIVLCAAFGFSRRPYYTLYPAPGLAQRMAARLPPGKTVVVTALPLYVFLSQYEPTHHYIFLLDWNFDLAPQRIKDDHSGERLMENWKRAGYNGESILPCDQILAQENSFTVLVTGNRSDWVKERLANPSFQTYTAGDFTEWFPFAIEHAQRIGPLTPNSCGPQALQETEPERQSQAAPAG